MITVAEIQPLRCASVDYEQTRQLKARLASLKQMRVPFYLTFSEFNEVLRWKLRGQYYRQVDLRTPNTEDLIQAITGLALTLSHADKNYEMKLRINILRCLRGVEIPVASAVIALVFPSLYAVIDFRGWRQVFGRPDHKSTFSMHEYSQYLNEIRHLAAVLGWDPQEVDLAIWEYDRLHWDTASHVVEALQCHSRQRP